MLFRSGPLRQSGNFVGELNTFIIEAVKGCIGGCGKKLAHSVGIGITGEVKLDNQSVAFKLANALGESFERQDVILAVWQNGKPGTDALCAENTQLTPNVHPRLGGGGGNRVNKGDPFGGRCFGRKLSSLSVNLQQKPAYNGV